MDENTKNSITVKALLDINQTIAKDFFARFEYPWEILPHIGKIIMEIGAGLSLVDYDKIGENIWISKTAIVAKSASITGPVIIGHNADIRHCAFIRGNALVGEGAVVGNSTELKNVILFNCVQVPHYNYVGDSILGYKAHMGAGAITSNVKSDKTNVVLKVADEKIETGMKKFGAILGDFTEIGCNSVMNPGTIIGRNSNVYPLSGVRGIVPENSIYKATNSIVSKI